MSTERPVSPIARVAESAALVLVVVGFPLIAGVSALIDVSSTPLSIAMRAVTALVCGLIAILSYQQMRTPLWWSMMIVATLFWTGYLLRLFNDTVYANFVLLYEPSSYWVWAVGGSIVPLFGLARARFTLADAPSHFRLCLLFTAAAALIALPQLSTVVETDYGGYDGGRAALAALNPISLGHLGVQLVLLCVWALLLNPVRVGAVWQAVYAVLILLGLYLTIASNSRGPLVALVAVVIFAATASRLSSKYVLLGGLFIGAATFAPVLAVVDQIAGTRVYERLLGQSQLGDENVLARIEIYDSAWGQFMRSPLTGSGLEDPVFGGYPHNIIIEAFMATGLIGGLLMIAILCLIMLCAFRVTSDHPAYSWLALLTVQQVIAMQFSGTIGQATAMWGLIGAMFAISAIGVVALRATTPTRSPGPSNAAPA